MADSPTRDEYTALRAEWARLTREADEAADRMARMTHDLLDRASSKTLRDWIEEDTGEVLSEHAVRHWDIRWHEREGVPREHATVKPDRSARAAS